MPDDQNRFAPPDDGPALDHLLAKARWPDMSDDAASRLEAVFRRQRRRQLVLHRTLIGFACAVMIATSLSLWPQVGRQVPKIAIRPDQKAIQQRAPNAPSVQIVSRPPTVFELAVLFSAQPPPQRREAHPQPPSSSQPEKPDPEAAVQSALNAVIRGGPLTDIAETLRSSVDYQVLEAALAAQLGAGPEERSVAAIELLAHICTRHSTGVLARLFERLDDPHVAVRLAAARALGTIDGPAVTARLAEMVQHDQNRREALAALISSTGPEAVHYLARARKSEMLSSQIRALELELKNPS